MNYSPPAILHSVMSQGLAEVEGSREYIIHAPGPEAGKIDRHIGKPEAFASLSRGYGVLRILTSRGISWDETWIRSSFYGRPWMKPGMARYKRGLHAIERVLRMAE